MRLIPTFLQPTPQKHRIRIALLISAAIHGAVLLWVRFDLPDAAAPIAIPSIEVTLIASPPEEALPSEEEPEYELVEPAPATEVSQNPLVVPKPAEHGTTPSVMEFADSEPTEPIVWQNIISSYAEEAATRNLEQERHRDVMWHKTFSVMFAPPEDWLIEDEPYLPDLQFEADKAIRLGIKISDNCYLGFPGIDPQTVDSDAPGWSGGDSPQPTIKLITCGFGD